MSRLGNQITGKRIFTVISLIVMALLIWFVGPLVAINEVVLLQTPAARTVAILLMLLLMVLVWGCWHFSHRKHDSAATTTTEEHVTEHSHRLFQSRIEAIKTQFNETLRLLKSSASGKNRQHYAYQVPWYLLLGNTDTGKSSLLQGSGLEFPFRQTPPQPTAFAKAKPYCDFWLSEQALLISVTEDEHGDQGQISVADQAWVHLLRLIKKYRRRQPVNAVIITLSVDELLQGSTDSLKKSAQGIRQRLQALHDQLGVAVPVYLILSKADKLPGFCETFSQLTKEERQQVWGMSLPVDALNEHDKQQWFDKVFQQLVDRLQAQQLVRIHRETDTQYRHRILNFPYQLHDLKPRLAEFIEHAFHESRFFNRAKLRGFYLTSAMQPATALQPMDTTRLNQPQRAFFITDLFTRVIFPEAGLVGLNRRYEQWARSLRTAILVGCISLVAMAGFGFSQGFSRNQLKLHQLDKATSDYDVRMEALHLAVKSMALVPVLTAAEQQQTVFSEGNSWLDYLGMDQGAVVTEALQRKHKAMLKGAFLQGLKNEIAAELKHPDQSSERLRLALKAYLMLQDQQHFNAAYLQQWTTELWQNRYFDQSKRLQILQQTMQQLLQDFPFVAVDEKLIASARARLRAMPVEQQVYAELRDRGRQAFVADYRFADILDDDFKRAFIQKIHRIPRLFTRKGYLKIVKPQLTAIIVALAEDNWVMGEEHEKLTDLEFSALQKKIEKRYFQDYIAHWQQHLDSVSLKSVTSLPELADRIQALRSSSSPIVAVLAQVSENSQLSLTKVATQTIQSTVASATTAGQRLTPKLNKVAQVARLAKKVKFPQVTKGSEMLLARRFIDVHRFVDGKDNKALPADQLLDQLAELQFYLESIINGGGMQEAAYQEAVARFSKPKQNIISRMLVLSQHYPQPVKRWIKQLLHQSWAQIMVAAKQYVGQQYQQRLYPFYEQTIAHRYPFEKRSSEEVTLSDFELFFAQEGLADRFIKGVLAPFIDTRRNAWRCKSIDGIGLGLQRRHLIQLQTLVDIRKSFFANNNELGVSLSLRPIYLDANISRFELNVLGQRQLYRHGPATYINVHWPEDNLNPLIAYQFEDHYQQRSNAEISGVWALLRFFQQNRVRKTPKGNRVQLTLENNHRKAIYEVKLDSRRSPLLQQQLFNLNLPATL